MNILVRPDGPHATTGTVSCKERMFPCVLGRSGVIAGDAKREGDGATPAGVYPLRCLWYRADKFEQEPVCALPKRVITSSDGWSDDVNTSNYNRPIELSSTNGTYNDDGTFTAAPGTESHECLWRPNDDLYDLLTEIGYNDNPPVPGLGSATSLHVARPAFTPTAGCIAMKKEDLLELLAMMDAEAMIEILEG